jgi:coenzyme F420-0:L-glutamate ligase/coenzyme F420-1:gamma-L-glutamate ligase
MRDIHGESEGFWEYLDRLIAQHELVIERPRGSKHPRYSNYIYPLDYGYLANTTSTDGGGIDVWVGSLEERNLGAVALTVDLHKRDTEIKLLLGCTQAELKIIMDTDNNDSIRSLVIQRRGELDWLRTRRSVRKFQKRQIPDELLQQVLETAAWAPSSHNRQPWRFAVLQSEEAKNRLVESMGADFRRDLLADGYSPEEVERKISTSHQRIVGAPAVIVLCLDTSQGDEYPDKYRQQAEHTMGIQSVALAGGYLLLAAHAVDLSGVWICAPLFVPNSVRDALELPQTWQPQALILLGYPDHIPEPRPRKTLKEVAIFL